MCEWFIRDTKARCQSTQQKCEYCLRRKDCNNSTEIVHPPTKPKKRGNVIGVYR